MSKKNRIKIPKQIKDFVYHRQKGRCCCCIELAKNCHHVKSVALGGENTVKNLVYLCEDHHKLLHLGGLETNLQILEYMYYLREWTLPDNIDQLRQFAEEMEIENIK